VVKFNIVFFPTWFDLTEQLMYSWFTIFYITIIYSEKKHASLEQNFTVEAKTLLHDPTFSTRNIQKFS